MAGLRPTDRTEFLMNKSLSTLLIAGMVAVGGVAQAETFDSPTQAGEASTMTNGAPNQLTTNSPYPDNSGVILYSPPVVDTTVLGASPSPDTEVTYIYRPVPISRTQAAATFNSPARAGEASTMTGGAPNMVTSNDFVINHSR
jgi:hypothetical protein